MPDSIRLKSTYSRLSQGARKIIEKAESQLLQNRVKCINKTIEDSGNRITNNKTKLASLVTSAGDLDMCSKFINEVRRVRYNKVKERQVRKFNYLLHKSQNKSLGQNNMLANNSIGQAYNMTSLDRISNNNTNGNEINNKWVINLSSGNLTQDQKAVLGKGPNFSIAPSDIPNVEYITAVESMCTRLKEEDAMELRADINSLLRKAKTHKLNLSKEERKGLSQLKKDKDKVVHTADKGWPW